MSNPNHDEARLLAGVALGGKSNSLQLFIQVCIVEAYLIILFPGLGGYGTLAAFEQR